MSDTDMIYEQFAKLPMAQVESAMANFDSKHLSVALKLMSAESRERVRKIIRFGHGSAVLQMLDEDTQYRAVSDSENSEARKSIAEAIEKARTRTNETAYHLVGRRAKWYSWNVPDKCYKCGNKIIRPANATEVGTETAFDYVCTKCTGAQPEILLSDFNGT